MPQQRRVVAEVGWKQETLADKVGVSKHTISKIENGDTEGSIQTLRKIAQALETEGIEFADKSRIVPTENVHKSSKRFRP